MGTCGQAFLNPSFFVREFLECSIGDLFLFLAFLKTNNSAKPSMMAVVSSANRGVNSVGHHSRAVMLNNIHPHQPLHKTR
jgi:hypothetical protein